MDSLPNFFVAIVILLVVLASVLGKLIPRDTWSDLVAGLLRDMIKGIWHFIFGAPKVRIQRMRRRWSRDP